uniref:SMC-Scp complex subunit ScpB n=1 Tax=candidate division WOR-3 bacterium TaxID=2052148 RepID=A0A7C6A8Y0_UNCW3
MTQDETAKIVEALLFAANTPLSLSRLAQLAGKEPLAIIQAIEKLNQDYETTGRTFRIHQVSSGYQLYTLPDYGQWVRSLFQHTHRTRLSKPSLEVLAIIAYEQPITKPEIEKLRGVDSSGPILTLLERKLIQVAGRAKRPGGPFLYRTTKEFLRYFGINDLSDLPRKEDLEDFLIRRDQSTTDEGPLKLVGTMESQVDKTAEGDQ